MSAPRDRISLLKADLTRIEATALVNAANTELWLGSGVAGAIARAAGPRVEAEAMAQGPIALGEAVVTRAGDLQARGILYIIHAASMEPGGQATGASVAAATARALVLATEKRMATIAFPAIGAGVGGLALAECAQVMLDAIHAHLAAHALPRLVHIALFDDDALAAFRAVHAGLPREAVR